MARSTFGGTTADFVSVVGPGGVVRAVPSTVKLYTAKTGGTQITDLLVGGVAATTVTADINGQLPEFQGPDGVVSMWADTGAGRVRINASITNEAVTDAVAAAVEIQKAGIDLGSKTYEAALYSANTDYLSTAGDIPGMAIVITGTGRPVDLDFFAPRVYHSVANTTVTVTITEGGSPTSSIGSQWGQSRSSSTTDGPSLAVRRRTKPLVAGTSYTFNVRVWAAAAGTSALIGSAFTPITFTATNR